MRDFFLNEFQYHELYPSIYEAIPEKKNTTAKKQKYAD